MKSRLTPSCFLIFLSLFGLFACGTTFEGYDEMTEGSYFRLERFGDQESAHEVQTYRLYALAVGPGVQTDSLLYAEMALRSPLPESIGEVAFAEKVLGMSPGDSLSFILPYHMIESGVFDLVFSEPASGMCRVEIGYKGGMSEQDYWLKYGEHMFTDSLEQVQYIEDLLARQGDESFIQSQGLFIKLIEKGDPQLPKGQTIALAYQGSFLDGEVFDKTPGDSAMYFRLGDPGQVLPGLELALQGCRDGDSIEVILPPFLAFGSRGAGNGLVPPNTPVRYRMRVKQWDNLR